MDRPREQVELRGVPLSSLLIDKILNEWILAQISEVTLTPFRVATDNSQGRLLKVHLWLEGRWLANEELHRIVGGQVPVWIRGSHPTGRDVGDLALPEPLFWRDLLLLDNTTGSKLWLERLLLPECPGLLVVLGKRNFPFQPGPLSLVWP